MLKREMTARPVDVWWIRHGESVRNAGLPTVDTYTAPLTELGHRQALRAASGLPRQPDLLIHSSFLRTQQTARAILDRFPESPVETWPVHEYHYLCDERTRNTTRMDREPMVREYWERCEPGHVNGVGAESFAGFIDRVDAAITRLRMRAEGWIVICSHQQFMQGVQFRLANDGEPGIGLMRRFCEHVHTQELPNAAMMRTRLSRAGSSAEVLAGIADRAEEILPVGSEWIRSLPIA